MLSAKHYVFIIVLVIVGLATSVLLMPSQNEIALMQMKDKHFDEARKAYEEQLAQGTMTLITANHLVDLYLQSGEVDKAVALMEKFTANRPNQLEARAKLGKLYQYAQRQDAFLHNLEEMNRIKPSMENLRTLSDIYNFNGQYDKQTDVLKQLIDMEQGKNPKTFVDLANIQAANHDYAGAATTLKEFKKRSSKQFEFQDIKLMVMLLFDADKQQDAIDAADGWMKTNSKNVPKDPQQAAKFIEDSAQLINIVHFRAGATKANDLLSYFSDDQINNNEDLLGEYALLAFDLGKEAEAYHRLKVLYESKHLPAKLYANMLLLAVSQDDKALTADVIAHIELAKLDDTQLMTLIESAISRGNTKLLSALTIAFTNEALREAHPLLATALAIGNHEQDTDARMAQLDKVTLEQSQLMQMASICINAKQNSCANHFIDKLPPPDDMSDVDVANVGSFYIAMKQWDKGYIWLHNAEQKHPSPAIEGMLAQFSAARGEDDKVKAWLDKFGNTASERTLQDMFYIAQENNHLSTASIVAEFFQQHHDSTQARRMVAELDIKMAKFEPAAVLLRGITPKSKTDEDNYLVALVHLAPSKPEYHKELADYALTILHSNATTDRKMEIVYLLIDAKAADVAVPVLRDMAGSANDQQKRNIADILLTQGDKADSEAIIMALAAKAAPGSEDVNNLLYIWGPRPTKEQMQWLETRFTQAPAKDKHGWAKHIGDTASSDFVLDFMNRHPESIEDTAIADKYFQALLDNGTFASKLNEGIASRNIAWLEGYIRTANAHQLRNEARKAYEAVLTINPSDMIALREAGMAASERADYKASEHYFSQYVNAYPGKAKDSEDWIAFFYYAELQRHNHKPDAAKSYYSKAYELLRDKEHPTAEMLSIKAQSMIRTGDVDGGLKVFAEARKQYPDNDGLRGDYISILTDLKKFDAAKKLLPKSTQSLANMAPKAGPPDIPSLTKDIKSYTLQEQDSQLLLRLAKPGEYAKRVRGLPWISYVNEGYDTLLIVAKPGYKIVVDDAGKTFHAVSEPTKESSKESGQTKLRYDLLAARIDLESGDIYDATQKLNQMTAEHPKEMQVLSLAASAEGAGGNWPRAEELMASARALSPEDSDLLETQREMLRLNAPNATLDQEFIHLGSDRESVQTLSGYVNATADTQVGTVLQNNFIDTRKIRLSDGSSGTFSNNRQRGEVYAQWNSESGQLAKGSFFANDVAPGLGGYYSFLDAFGQTAITAEWNKPYWEYAQTVVDEGTRDRLAILQTVKPSDRLTVSNGVGYNHYNVEHTEDVASAVSVQANVTYRLIEGQPFLDLGYGLDAEYIGHSDKSVDSTGALTRILPITSHEIHALVFGTGYNFSEHTYGSFDAGYAYDRLSGHGPLASAKLTEELTKAFDLQLHAMYGYSSASSGTNNTVTRFGASVRWRFQS